MVAFRSNLCICFLVVTLAWSVPPTAVARGAQREITVRGIGFVVDGNMAAARDRAIRDAQVRALERSFGVEVDARTALHKSLLVDDTLLTRTRGVVESYRILSEGIQEQGLYVVQLKAVVDTDTMNAALRSAAGAKRVLAIGAGKNAAGDILFSEIADAFTAAGFKLRPLALPKSKFLLLDREKIAALGKKMHADFVLKYSMHTGEGSCPAENFCAARADGRLALFTTRLGTKFAGKTVTGVRGFGNTAARARSQARRKAAAELVHDLMMALFYEREQIQWVEVLNVPDYRTYRSIQNSLEVLRWVKHVRPDSVGFDTRRSVFRVYFNQDPELLAAMLARLQGCRLQGYSDGLFTLEYRRP